MLLSSLKAQQSKSFKYVFNPVFFNSQLGSVFLQVSHFVQCTAPFNQSHSTLQSSTKTMAPEWRKQAKAARARKGQHNHGHSRPPLTHFLCLPLVTVDSKPVLKAFLDRFKNETNSISGLDPRIKDLLDQRSFRAVGTLHFTLGVMSLKEVDKLNEAVQLLNDLDIQSMLRESMQKAKNDEDDSSSNGKDSSKVEPLEISLKSLKAMRSNTNTSVLYVEPLDDSGRLKHFCEALQAAFVDKSIVIKEDRPLKLHVTILNSIYGKPAPPPREESKSSQTTVAEEDNEDEDEEGEEKPEAKQGGDGDVKMEDSQQSESKSDIANVEKPRRNHRRGRPRPVQFDATPMLDQFKDVEWTNKFRLERVAICKMTADRICDDAGFTIDELYEEVAVRELP